MQPERAGLSERMEFSFNQILVAGLWQEGIDSLRVAFLFVTPILPTVPIENVRFRIPTIWLPRPRSDAKTY